MADSHRKTENLFYSSNNQTVGSTLRITQTIGNSKFILNKNESQTDTSANIEIDVTLPAGTYTLSVTGLNLYNNDYDRVFLRNDNLAIVVQNVQVNRPQSFTLTETTHIYRATVVAAAQSTYNNTTISIMLNTGSTALPYEPYGWVHSLRKLGTATDTLTILPADLYADGNNATVGISGNMSQTGTPTPQNPIQPSECGDKTANLFPVSSFTGKSNIVLNNFNSASETIEFLPNTQYTISLNYSSTLQTGVFKITFIYTDETSSSSDWLYGTTHRTLTSNAGKTVSSISLTNYAQYVDVAISDIMLNSGSTELTFEPFGVKIPISSAGTTTPVYLGEIESTRRIKKLVLTGEETWAKGEYPISDSAYHFYMPNPTGIMGNLQSWIISHFVCGRLINGTAMGLFFNFYPQTSLLPENPTANDFKAWIAAQYAAGTPVTIWYVLATPEIGIVNEPIRKIGDYADTVSGITIPTTEGADSFDVLTTLKPSEVTANYHGWHTGAVHERDSNYTIATMQALTIAQLQTHTISELEGGEWS